jgi:cytoskeletal protein RodZ
MGAKFIQKKIAPTETLGQIFRKRREDSGLTLEHISRKTKIRQTYLEALEENDYSSLPSDPYTKGILKKYAEYLGIPQEKALSLYQRQKGIDQYVKNKKPLVSTQHITNPRVIITPKTIFISLAILIFVTILGYIFWQYQSFATSPELSISYPPDNITVNSSSITIEGKTDPHADLSINQQGISLENNGNFRTIINLQNGVNFINITAKNRINKETTIVRKILAKIPVTQINPKKQVPKNALELTVQINPNSAWLYIEADNKQVYQGIMLPGTNQVFTANEYISLTTRNGGSVEVLFNGKDLGKLGAEGKVIQGLRFDKNTKIE